MKQIMTIAYAFCLMSSVSFSQEYFTKTYDYREFTNNLDLRTFSTISDSLIVLTSHICPDKDSICTNIMIIDHLGNIVDTNVFVFVPGNEDAMIVEEDRFVLSGRNPYNGHSTINVMNISGDFSTKKEVEITSSDYFKIFNQGIKKHNQNYYSFGTFRSTNQPNTFASYINTWNNDVDRIINIQEIRKNAIENHIFDLQSTIDDNLVYMNYVEHHNVLDDSLGHPDHYFITKINEEGDELGQFYHGESTYDFTWPSLLAHSNGSYYFSSLQGENRLLSLHGMLHRVNPELTDFDWSVYFPVEGTVGRDEEFYKMLDISECANGDILVCGEDDNNNFEDIAFTSAFILRMDSENGDVIWKRVYRFPKDSSETRLEREPFRYTSLRQVKEAPNGDIIAMGDHRRWSNEINDFYYDMLLIKMNADGCIDGEECQDYITVDGEYEYNQKPMFDIGTKWTYDFTPYTVHPNEIIHSYIQYEVTDTFRMNDSLIYIVSNNRGIQEEWMYQDRTRISFWDWELEAWQLTYKFNTTSDYQTKFIDYDGEVKTTLVELDTILYKFGAIFVGSRGTDRVQKIRIVDNGSITTPLELSILNRIGKIWGGLRLGLGEGLWDPEYRIGKIRCYEQGDFFWNFDELPLPWGIACDSVYIEVIDGLEPAIELSGIKIYPNPTNDIINIEGSHLFNQYKIYDALGRLMQSGKSTSKIEMIAMQQGLYFLDLYSEGKEKVRFKVSKL